MPNNPKNVKEMIHLHDVTQEGWEKRVKDFSDKLEEQEENVKHIRTSLKKLRNQISDLDITHCVKDSSFQEMSHKYDKMCEKYDEGQKQLTEILIKLESLSKEMLNKKETDKLRNGKVDKLDEKEDNLDNRVTVVETKIELMNENLKTIISLIKALGVGFVIFFVTFIIKTFFWGY